MARAIISSDRRSAFEPLYDRDPQTAAVLEVFYADHVLARSFGRSAGWFWWSCQPGCLPEREPCGPFPTSYTAYRNATAARRDCSQNG